MNCIHCVPMYSNDAWNNGRKQDMYVCVLWVHLKEKEPYIIQVNKEDMCECFQKKE